jgi:hypothetical protein
VLLETPNKDLLFESIYKEIIGFFPDHDGSLGRWRRELGDGFVAEMKQEWEEMNEAEKLKELQRAVTASAQNTQPAVSGKTSAQATPLKSAGPPKSPVRTTSQQTTPVKPAGPPKSPVRTTSQQTTPVKPAGPPKSSVQTTPQEVPPTQSPEKLAPTQLSAGEEAEQSLSESGEEEQVELGAGEAVRSLLGKRDSEDPVDLRPLFAQNGGEALDEFEHMADDEAALLADPRDIMRYDLAQMRRWLHGGKRQKTDEWEF